MPKIDSEVLRAALIGYSHQRQTIEEKIAELERQLGGRTPKAAVSSDGATRKMSASARRRIAAAQKKRWAAPPCQHS